MDHLVTAALRGTVIDLAGAVARAEQAIAAAGLGHRAGTRVGSFFDAQGDTPYTEGDLRMLRYVRSRERTLDQLRDLAKSVGLQVSSVTPTGSRSIIELRPSH